MNTVDEQLSMKLDVSSILQKILINIVAHSEVFEIS